MKLKQVKLCQDSSVSRASVWSHTVSGGMIAPGFEFHQCLTGMWKKCLGCHAGQQGVAPEVNPGERVINTYAFTKLEYGCPLWLWNPEVQNRGISGPTKMTHVLQKFNGVQASLLGKLVSQSFEELASIIKSPYVDNPMYWYL